MQSNVERHRGWVWSIQVAKHKQANTTKSQVLFGCCFVFRSLSSLSPLALVSMKAWSSTRIILSMLSSAALFLSGNTRRGVVLAFSSRTSSFTTSSSSLRLSATGTSTCRRSYSSTTLSMKLQTAIVGLPNVGTCTIRYTHAHTFFIFLSCCISLSRQLCYRILPTSYDYQLPQVKVHCSMP